MVVERLDITIVVMTLSICTSWVVRLSLCDKKLKLLLFEKVEIDQFTSTVRSHLHNCVDQ